MSMDLINEEIRSLMSGDVSRDSKLALILFGSPTVANKAIKDAKTQAGGLTKLLEETLKPFEHLETIMTYDKQMNNLLYQIQEVQREAAKPLFKDLQSGAKELTEYLKANGAEITRSLKDIYTVVKTATPYILDLVSALAAYKALGIAKTVVTPLGEWAVRLTKLTSRVGALRTGQLLLNRAILANPYAIAATALFGLYKVLDQMTKGLTPAQQALKDFREELEGVSDAAFAVQEKDLLGKIKEAQAVQKKLAENAAPWENIYLNEQYRTQGQLVTEYTKKLRTLYEVQAEGVFKGSILNLRPQRKKWTRSSYASRTPMRIM
jgi:hypothetical protein